MIVTIIFINIITCIINHACKYYFWGACSLRSLADIWSSKYFLNGRQNQQVYNKISHFVHSSSCHCRHNIVSNIVYNIVSMVCYPTAAFIPPTALPGPYYTLDFFLIHMFRFCDRQLYFTCIPSHHYPIIK